MPDRPGPVKAWIEPDRWAFARAFPFQAALAALAIALSSGLAIAVHPGFWVIAVFAWFRHAAAEASLRELWREGMLHPARVLAGARNGLIATLVRLEGERGVQDAVVISRIPRRWGKAVPPWGGERAAVVIAGHPPRLRPLSADFAVGDIERGRRATARIPEPHWDALGRALLQVPEMREGVHPVQLGAEAWYGSLRQVEAEGSLPVVPDGRAQSFVWCAGLPCVEEPEMVAEERRKVEAFRKRAWLRVGLYGFSATVVPVLCFMRLGVHYARGGEVTPLAAFAAMAVLVVAPFALLGTLGFWGRARAYGRDLAGGKVLRFVGSLSSFDSLGLDPDLALLTRRGFLEAEPGVEQELVLLPESRELLYANRRWAPPGMGLHAGQVAMPPESPMRVALPEEVEAQTANHLDVARRRLTPAEIDELGRHIQMLRSPGKVFWVLLSFAVLALVSWELQGFQWPPRPLTIPLMLLAFVFALLLLGKRIFLARRLQRDADLGWVLTVDHAADAASDDETDLPAQGVETLLHGQLDWTVNRRPAAWRRFGVRRRG